MEKQIESLQDEYEISFYKLKLEIDHLAEEGQDIP